MIAAFACNGSVNVDANLGVFEADVVCRVRGVGSDVEVIVKHIPFIFSFEVYLAFSRLSNPQNAEACLIYLHYFFLNAYLVVSRYRWANLLHADPYLICPHDILFT